MPRIDLNHLRVFERVAAHGGFSAAARELGMPRSSVSRAVALLEEAVGTRLMQRTTRSVALTAAGSALHARLSGILSDLGGTLDYLEGLGGTPSGPLRVSAGIALGINVLGRHLPAFLRRHPAIELELHLESARVDLVAEGIDVALRFGKLADSSMVAQPAWHAGPPALRRAGLPRRAGRPGAAGGPRRAPHRRHADIRRAPPGPGRWTARTARRRWPCGRPSPSTRCSPSTAWSSAGPASASSRALPLRGRSRRRAPRPRPARVEPARHGPVAPVPEPPRTPPPPSAPSPTSCARSSRRRPGGGEACGDVVSARICRGPAGRRQRRPDDTPVHGRPATTVSIQS